MFGMLVGEASNWAVQLEFFKGRKRVGRSTSVVPEGLRYQPALISSGDEATLVSHMRELPFREFEFHGYLGKRRVVSFGWKYDFGSQRLQKADEIPHYLVSLRALDRKSTRLNSSHGYISYAVFCLKKKKNNMIPCTSI